MKRHWEKKNMDLDEVPVMGNFPGSPTTPETLVLMFYLLQLCQQWTAKAPQAKCYRSTFPECWEHKLPPASNGYFTLLLSVGKSYCRSGAVDSFCIYHSPCIPFLHHCCRGRTMATTVNHLCIEVTV